MHKRIFIIIIALLVAVGGCKAYAAVTVSGAGKIIVNRVETLTIQDVSGNKKLRITMSLSGPYISEYESIISNQGMNTAANIKFENLALAAGLATSLAQAGKVADELIFTAGADNLRVTVNSQENDLGEAVVTVLAKGRTTPWRIIIDVPLLATNYYANTSSGLNGKKIVLDPGHGGSDSGAIGPSGVTEKAVNLAIAGRLKKLLNKAGAIVIMTRESDVDCSYPNSSDVEELAARVACAEKYKPDIFVSIHNDAFYNRNSNGTGTYYYAKSNQDVRLAKDIQSALQRSVGLVDRGTKKANFYVLRNTRMPAALVEVAFISNLNEEKLLTDAEFQQKAARGIFEGVNDYFNGR